MKKEVSVYTDKITVDLIMCYIKYHRDEVHGKQLKMF